MKRKEIRFHGRVQGVGFRWTASNLARDLGVTGWVRNEYDGTVLMEAQGTQEQIDDLVARLMADRYIRIDTIDVKSKPVETNEVNFMVRH